MKANMDPHGTFPVVTSPIPWKLETNMEPNIDPHGIFFMVTSPIPQKLETNMEAKTKPRCPCSVSRRLQQGFACVALVCSRN